MKKTELVLGLLILVLGAGLFVLNRQSAGQTDSIPPQHGTTVTENDSVLPGVTLLPFAPTFRTHTRSNQPAAQPSDMSAQVDAANELDQDDLDALALVGIDDEADQFWLNAIFDTSLPDKQREDLMEDLNEVGFDDPKNLTADDLPLIMNRLELIEAVLPNADDFMREHLLEAEKDLLNMLASVTGQPQQ
jgi:hypothetical protein